MLKINFCDWFGKKGTRKLRKNLERKNSHSIFHFDLQGIYARFSGVKTGKCEGYAVAAFQTRLLYQLFTFKALLAKLFQHRVCFIELKNKTAHLAP